MGSRIVGPKRQGATMCQHRLLETVQIGKCEAHLVVGFGTITVEAQRRFIFDDCLLKTLHLEKRVAEVEMAHRVIGSELNRSGVLNNRLVQHPAVSQGVAKTVMD